MKTYTKYYNIEFTEGLLGTKPNDQAVHDTFIKGKELELIPEDEQTVEAKTIAELDKLEKGKLIFHRDEDGTPLIWDYQVKGFLKEAFRILRRNPENACSKVKAFLQIIDDGIFVQPRKIRLTLPEGVAIGTCQRPLRAQTMQGERVALASSEEAPAGTKMKFSVTTMVPDLDKALAECWEYAEWRFMGGWRNSGKGRAHIVEVSKAEWEKQ